MKPCPFCGGDVRFDKAYSYFRDSVIYCDGCDMVFTLDDCTASDDDIARAWNRRVRVEVPAADVAPVRRGHWIEENGCQICSECGEEHEWDEYRAAYCDVCGAKMEVDNG